MKVFKLIVTLIILCLIGLFIYQNMETWRKLIDFRLDLYLLKTDSQLQVYMIILLSAVLGFIVGLGSMIKPYFKTRRLLKSERSEKKQAGAEPTTEQAESHSETSAPASTGEQ
jgi:uncharacterized integral membrane protein